MSASRTGSVEDPDVLRAKYLDYSSAQVADLLLYLSPDEIYLLAQRAHREDGHEGDLSYGEMVRGATEYLARKISLPPFEVWKEDYLRHPDRYEKYLMGLWRSEPDPADVS